MDFYSNTRRTPRMAEKFTNREQVIYKEVTNPKTGVKELVEKERIDIVDKISEYKDEVTLSNMLNKYRVDLASQVRNDQEKFIDLTQLPENLIETMATIDNAKELWNNQSAELKKEFNNNFREFLAGTENGKLVELVNKHTKRTQEQQIKQPQHLTYNDILVRMQKQDEIIANLQKQTPSTKGDNE